jgi:DNA-binding LacI/PurR family transcriptional regulator
VRRGEGTLEDAYSNTLSLLDLPAERRPSAIVTLVDIMALGAVHAIQERGYLVGQEIGVTGFDDTPLSRHVRPSLTTLRQPVEQVGTLSVELLMNTLNAGQPAQSQFLLLPELIVRESSLRRDI